MRRGNTTDNETMKIMEEDVQVDGKQNEMRRDDTTGWMISGMLGSVSALTEIEGRISDCGPEMTPNMGPCEEVPRPSGRTNAAADTMEARASIPGSACA